MLPKKMFLCSRLARNLNFLNLKLFGVRKLILNTSFILNCLRDLAAKRPLSSTVFIVKICHDTISFTQTETNPQPENLSVDTTRKTYSCYPSRHTFPHPPLSLALPSYPTFPSHPLGVLCATAETTDGAQHH